MRLSKRSKVVTGAIVIVLVLFVTLYLPDYSNISDRSVSDYEQQDFIRLKDTTRKTVEKTQSEDDLPTIDDPFAKEDPDSKTHFIIYGAGRSGTTWLSAFFRSQPDLFFVFEPMYNTFALQKRGCQDNSTMRRACTDEILGNLFSCNFHSSDLTVLGRYPFYKRNKTTIPDLEQECQQRTHVLSKIVRMADLRDIEQVAKHVTNFKIIHLVRDPRPLIRSRAKQLFGGIIGNHHYVNNEPTYTDETYKADSKELCSQILHACKLGDTPPGWLKGRYMRIRHEDLSLDTIPIAKKLYKFVNLPWEKQIEDWIHKSTLGLIKERPNGFYSVNRISNQHAFRWRETEVDQIDLVNEACGDLIHYLKYLW